MVNPFIATKQQVQTTDNSSSKSKYWVNLGLIQEIDGEEKFIKIGGFSMDKLFTEKQSNTAYGNALAVLSKTYQEVFNTLEPSNTHVVNLGAIALQFRHATDEPAVNNAESSEEILRAFGL